MAMGRPREFDTDQALDSALKVFWQKGYEGASMPDLTKAMGINKPSVYAAFGNKEELFRKALERYIERKQQALQEALDQPTARAAVEKFFGNVISANACTETPKGCLLVQGAIAGGAEVEPIRQELAARRAAGEAAWRARFERAVAEGDLPADTNPGDLARYISSIAQGMAVHAGGGATCADLKGVVQVALKAFPASK